MVIGTRTTRQLIEQGTNMHGTLRWGNVLVASGSSCSGGACSRASPTSGAPTARSGAPPTARIRPLLRGVGPELSPEMMVAVLEARMRIIEVPVSYHRRMGGESKHSANYRRIARTALAHAAQHHPQAPDRDLIRPSGRRRVRSPAAGRSTRCARSPRRGRAHGSRPACGSRSSPDRPSARSARSASCTTPDPGRRRSRSPPGRSTRSTDAAAAGGSG